MTEPDQERALLDVAHELRRLRIPFAVVGGIAVSVRAEVRFTRDVDLAVSVENDQVLGTLVRDLGSLRYHAGVIVEHEARNRLATVRLVSPSGVTVDLIAASCGIEDDVVARSTPVAFGADSIPVARAEELVAMT